MSWRTVLTVTSSRFASSGPLRMCGPWSSDNSDSRRVAERDMFFTITQTPSGTLPKKSGLHEEAGLPDRLRTWLVPHQGSRE